MMTEKKKNGDCFGDTIRVSSTSNPHMLAAYINTIISEFGRARLRAVGAAATNQAVKALAVCRVDLVTAGAEIVCVPSFSEVAIEGRNRTAICFDVELRWPEAAAV